MDTLSSNIKRYRSNKNLTQQELSELSGVSLPSIKNIERMKSIPRTNTLLDLSKALDCRLQDLVIPVKELSSIRFRARKKMNRREHVISQVSKWLNDFSFLESLMSDKKEYKFSKLGEARKELSPKQFAEEARKILGLKEDEPIHDISGLIESCGIKLLSFPYSSDAFNGLSVGVDDQGPAIIVNTWERISVERQIFSTAHELGHLLMHLADYNGEILTENKEQEKEREKEADLFAGYFLMPECGFNSEWAETYGMPFLDRVMKIKSIFKVSYKTVLYRLKQNGVVDNSIWFKFKTLYEARYNKKLAFKDEPFPDGSEPFGLKPFDFYADRLSRIVRIALEEDQISISRAAEIMNLSSQQMMERISEWEDFA
ncbi:MAG: ImmA/IrrE family metallo-endopeptidase [Bacteroidales bacterium]|nr:ImmA/IrrE family metallo-endopeptidase [Bacteroidales bacterium]